MPVEAVNPGFLSSRPAHTARPGSCRVRWIGSMVGSDYLIKSLRIGVRPESHL